MRLDKFICESTELTRREAKILLKKGSVTIDSSVCKDAAFKVKPEHEVCIGQQLIKPIGLRYIMMHKPVDTICSTQDEAYQSVISLLAIERAERLHIAGRLDADTTGLVLITDDGQWSHQITAPKKDCQKTYLATLAEPLTSDAISQLEQGIMLNGESKATLPAKVETVSAEQARLTISEGKYHQVKRMFAAVGNKVVALHREQIGQLSLDADLEPSEWRFLKPDEIALFRN